MDFALKHISLVLLVQFGWNKKISKDTMITYNIGVYSGIINPNKYTLDSFNKHEPMLKEEYREAIIDTGGKELNFYHYLVTINFGLINGTQTSYYENHTGTLRDSEDQTRNTSKARFVRTVRTGDILISTKHDRGLIGHAALMVSDYWVLEMRHVKKCHKKHGANQELSKSDWFDRYSYYWTTVYRCPDKSVARKAAYWADHNYFNPSGGQEQTIMVDYKVTGDFESIDPSYSSKLVLQAYYYGAEGVVDHVDKYGPIILPSRIPSYFLPPYELLEIGKF